MPRYRVNLNIRDRAAEQRAQNEYLQDEFNRNRTQTLDMRAAVDRSTYQGTPYDPQLIAQNILAQMDIAETMTDEKKGPDSRVMRAVDRKINYGWKYLWRLAYEGDEEAMQQINMLQEEVIEYKQIRVKYQLKKIRLYVYGIAGGIMYMVPAVSGSFDGFVPLAIGVSVLIFLPYFFIIERRIKRKAHDEAVGKYS